MSDNSVTKMRWLDVVWVVALMAYGLIGVSLTPFHGDESTLIHNTTDYAYQFIQRDLSWVLYDGNPAIDPMDQQYRLLDGRIHKYLGGFFWHVAGYTPADLNRPWLWGADWDYNRTHGHIPDDGLLHVTRLASAVLMAAGVWAMFALMRRLENARIAAYVASAAYAFNPALLLNGRRSMMEGALMGCTLLAVWAALHFVNARQRRGVSVVFLGLAAGLTLSSKLTGALVVGLLFAGLGIYALWRDRAALKGLVAAGILALAVFYALNPTWWGDPFARVQEVMQLRSAFIQTQTTAFESYPDLWARVVGFWDYAIVGQPQFYEIAAWQGFIGAQIDAYLASPWAGVVVGASGVGVLIVCVLLILGVGRLVRFDAPMPAERWVIGVWGFGVMAALLLITHIPWQRYYLPAILPLCVLMGLGAAALAAMIQNRANRRAH